MGLIPEAGYPKTRAVCAILLAHFCFVAIAVESDWSHFTWWSIATTAIYAFFLAFYPITAATYFFFFLSLQIAVIAGTVVMGFFKCDVFETAFDKNGAGTYIGGNFLMHFVPTLAAVLLVDTNEVVLNTSNTIFSTSALGLGVYLVWEFFRDPLVIYGCNNINSPTVSLFGAAIAVFATAWASVVAIDA